MSNQQPQVAVPVVHSTPSKFEPRKVRFFWMSSNYNNYLRGIDDRVRCNIKNGKARPSVAVGIVLNGHNYLIPLTSQNSPRWNNQLTVRIKEEVIEHGATREEVVSCLKINNMHPALESELTYIDFEEQTENYKRLLYKEYDYIKKNLGEIQSKAIALHKKIKQGKAKHFKDFCCDFTKLEANYKNYNPAISYPPIRNKF